MNIHLPPRCLSTFSVIVVHECYSVSEPICGFCRLLSTSFSALIRSSRTAILTGQLLRWYTMCTLARLRGQEAYLFSSYPVALTSRMFLCIPSMFLTFESTSFTLSTRILYTGFIGLPCTEFTLYSLCIHSPLCTTAAVSLVQLYTLKDPNTKPAMT